MIRGISFDCFGVLLEDSWLSFSQQYSDVPEQFDALRLINRQVDSGQATYDEFLEVVAKIGHISKEEAWKIIQKGHRLNRNLFAYIETLKPHYKLGLLSNVGQPIERYIPKEWSDIFEVKTLSYLVGSIKPDHEIYKVHIEAMRLKPEEIVFIDDREPNCEAAEALGMKTVWYKSLKDLKAQLSSIGIEV